MQGGLVILTNGCFDLLHAGHAYFLRTLKSVVASTLHFPEARFRTVVAVNSDRSVQDLKGLGRPINPERERLEVVASIRGVDLAFLFDSLRTADVIRALCPTVVVKSGKGGFVLDPAEKEACAEVCANFLATDPVFSCSTSAVIERIQNHNSFAIRAGDAA
jgi:D-beta-D-heptose 7-phosphate kinase/D-beta-D-heptose 1-phosphate adenosyltransferase